MRRLRYRSARRLFPVVVPQALLEPSSFISRAQISQALEAPSDKRLTVCFTGHRHLPDPDIPEIAERLEQLLALCYQRGYRYFLCGGALGFDTLVAECVVALQNRYTDVKLVFVLPCSRQALPWSSSQGQRYERLLYAADEIKVLSTNYYQGCMHVRNRYMIDHSNLCICYLRHTKGGTASTVAYAIKKQLPVLNTAMADVCAAFPAE